MAIQQLFGDPIPRSYQILDAVGNTARGARRFLYFYSRGPQGRDSYLQEVVDLAEANRVLIVPGQRDFVDVN